MTHYPAIAMSKTWQDWAAKLIKVMSSAEEIEPVQLPVYAKTDLPQALTKGLYVYVSDDVGGAVTAFSDGANWRRTTDRAIIS